ncbi:MAG: phosphoribosylformylglycinamidine cyclo-ligase [Euryarchaeota archaeon]|nr:phosphoribosylformylglycinamidine cyclo-ligase [Euryarchaeota archaeon]
MTYARAGVDIGKKSKAIESLVDQLRYRRDGRFRMLDIKGQFTGLVDFGEFALTLCTDGVGTKLLIAEATGRWDTVGIDCIAMNVNDTICVGAEPVAFVDYIAIDRPDNKIAEQIGMGLEKGAEMANVDIVGGEVAVLPEIVKGVDLSGSCLGVVRKEDIVDGSGIGIGDAIIGLPSSGVHSNGLTLARKILERNEISYGEIPQKLGKSVGEELLTPTKIYVREVLRVLREQKATGMVNMTGGGLRNFIRLKKGVFFEISEPLPPQPIFEMLADLGDVDPKEMYQTFNMGMGFAIVCREAAAEDVVRILGGGARIVGSVVEGDGAGSKRIGVRYDSY